MALCKDLTVYSPEQFKQDYSKEYHKESNIDVIIGGPSCQGCSLAGKRDSNDPRNVLFREFVKYVQYFRPKIFVMENVIGLLSMKTEDGTKYIDVIIDSFEQIQYNTTICKLYACDFGVPQTRRRVIIFGIHKKYNTIIKEPEPLLSKQERVPVSTVLEQHVDEKYYLSERAITGIVRKKEKAKQEGKGFGAQFLDLNKPSFTIPSRYWKDGYDALVKESDTIIRRLTIKELVRIQTFPDDYIFKGSNKDIIIQIGNAVACTFSHYIAMHLLNTLNCLNDTTLNVQSNVQENIRINVQPKHVYSIYKVPELKKLCKERNIKGYSRLTKQLLIEQLEAFDAGDRLV